MLLAPDDWTDPPSSTDAVVLAPGDLRIRLLRHVVGVRQHQVPELVWRMEERGLWQERPDPVPERERAVRTGAQKQTAHTVEPAPNAPKLIRLVQHPYALETVRPVRDPASTRPARVQVHELSREPFDKGRQDAQEEARRLPFPKPSQVRDRLQARPRPSADAWLEAR